MTGNEMVGWHRRLGGHEFEQALGVGEGQGCLACCSSPWGCKESDTTEWLNWTEMLNAVCHLWFFIHSNVIWVYMWPSLGHFMEFIFIRAGGFWTGYFLCYLFIHSTNIWVATKCFSQLLEYSSKENHLCVHETHILVKRQKVDKYIINCQVVISAVMRNNWGGAVSVNVIKGGLSERRIFEQRLK